MAAMKKDNDEEKRQYEKQMRDEMEEKLKQQTEKLNSDIQAMKDTNDNLMAQLQILQENEKKNQINCPEDYDRNKHVMDEKFDAICRQIPPQKKTDKKSFAFVGKTSTGKTSTINSLFNLK